MTDADLFPLLRALQSAMALSALVLVLICGNALIRHIRWQHQVEGWWITAVIWLWSLINLISFGHFAIQYWLYDVNHPIANPIPLRLMVAAGFLLVAAGFIARVQPAYVGAWRAFIIWSALVAVMVTLTTFLA